jgi:hypothetical protein
MMRHNSARLERPDVDIERCRHRNGDRQLTYYMIKIAVTAVLIVAIAEIAKRSSFLGAILASVPLISLLALTWLYIDTKDVSRVSTLATSVFWLVLPSLAFFVTFPMLLKHGLHFYLSVSVSILVTAGCYWLMVTALGHYGIKL